MLAGNLPLFIASQLCGTAQWMRRLQGQRGRSPKLIPAQAVGKRT